MPQKRGRRRRRQPSNPTATTSQLGEGIGAVVAGIPKVSWKITKGLETLAKKNARKSHLKRMAKVGNENCMPGNPSIAVSCELSCIKRDESREEKKRKSDHW